MKAYISLLRGINVGGHKKIKMADLKSLYESLGFEDVNTYIQSGNVVFQSKETDFDILANSIHNKIKDKYGFEVPITIRQSQDIENIIKTNPFLAKAEDIKMLYVGFMNEIPNPELVASTKEIAFKDDKFEVIGKTLFLYVPSGAGKTKFTNSFFERKFKVSITTRNWRTTLKLAEMCN